MRRSMGVLGINQGLWRLDRAKENIAYFGRLNGLDEGAALPCCRMAD